MRGLGLREPARLLEKGIKREKPPGSRNTRLSHLRLEDFFCITNESNTNIGRKREREASGRRFTTSVVVSLLDSVGSSELVGLFLRSFVRAEERAGGRSFVCAFV